MLHYCQHQSEKAPIPAKRRGGGGYGQIQTLNEGNYSNYNGLILKARHRFAQNYTVITSYTLSHCLQDGEIESNDLGNNGPSYQNPDNRNADYGPCDADIRHAFVASVVVHTPTFTNNFLKAALGDWEISPIITAQTGSPFNPISGIDNSRTALNADRPNVTGDPYLKNRATLQWLNPASYTANAVGTFGNAGWNSVRIPHYVNVDAALARTFPVREAFNFQFRAEAFNLLNHTNFGQPANNKNTSTFGSILSSNPARILQLAVKMNF